MIHSLTNPEFCPKTIILHVFKPFIASGFVPLAPSNDKIHSAVKLLPQEVHT